MDTLEAEKQRGKEEIKTESAFLREAAERRERRGELVTALLFRNEAVRLELGFGADSFAPQKGESELPLVCPGMKGTLLHQAADTPNPKPQ